MLRPSPNLRQEQPGADISLVSPTPEDDLTPSKAAMTGIGNFSQAPMISLPRATKGPT